MAKIIIDNVSYNADNLSEQTQQQVNMLQYIEQEIGRAQAHLAVLQTAKGTCVHLLKQTLPVSTENLTLNE